MATNDLRILHCFADTGAENPCLDRHGDVLRVGLDVTPNDYSDGVQADARHLPFHDTAQFDLGVFHPPCGGVSPMSDTGEGSRDDWPDLIPTAREVARQHCDHWIIENKPRESLDAEVVLDGHMFQLGIEYKRAFETSFPVEQPPQQNRLAETSPFYYTEKPHGWWASVKGSSTAFTKQHLAKNTIPSAYLDYLLRHYYKAVETGELADYSEYDKEMDTRRSKATNESLEAFQ
jgi:hypothetical protein